MGSLDVGARVSVEALEKEARGVAGAALEPTASLKQSLEEKTQPVDDGVLGIDEGRGCVGSGRSGG